MNIEELEFEVTENPSSKDLDFLTQKINEESVDQGSAFPFAIFVRDKEGRIIAGCNGSIIFGAIYTDQLWIHLKYRKKGLGTKLMNHVHVYGKKKGCTQATVTTMSFQAPDFYQNLGYTIDFCRQGYSKDSTCIFLSKQL